MRPKNPTDENLSHSVDGARTIVYNKNRYPFRKEGVLQWGAKRLLTVLLALVMVASLFAVSAAGADKRPWEDAYRQAIKDNTDKYAGWTLELVDLDLNTAHRSSSGGLPRGALFQMVESMFTFENNTLKKVTLQDVNNTMMGDAGTFEGEEIPYYVAYRNDATGACKIELHWLIRNGYREHGAFLGTCTLANGVYTQQTHYCHHVMDNVSTYYVGDPEGLLQSVSELAARAQQWLDEDLRPLRTPASTPAPAKSRPIRRSTSSLPPIPQTARTPSAASGTS